MPENEHNASSASSLKISFPEESVTINYQAVEGSLFYFDFPLGSAQFSVDDGDLLIVSGSGSMVVLQDFIALADSANPPKVSVQDGQPPLPGGVELLSQLNDFVEPAASPLPYGGGSGEYRDDFGDSLTGVDRLDPLASRFTEEDNNPPDDTLVGLNSYEGVLANSESSEGSDEGEEDNGGETPIIISPDSVAYAVLSGADSVEEGEVASYTVSLVDSDGNPVEVTEPTEVTITFTSGTAEAGDYAETPVTVTIQPGDSSATVDIATFDDVDFDDETFTAELTSVEDTGEFEAIEVGTDSSIETTIVDNDTAPTLSINDVTVDEGAGTATFTVSLDHATTAPVSFDYATADGSADADDYTSVSGSLEIPTGSTEVTITVPITDDLYSEGDETFTVILSNVSDNVDLTGSDLEGVGTIQDSGSGAGIDVPDADDTVYAVLSGDTDVEEGETASYTVSLIDSDGNSVEVTEPTEVTITLTSGTAEAGDYAETPVTVTIQPGQSSATVDIATFEDVDFDDETFAAEITTVEDTGEFEAIEVGTDSSIETTIIDNDTAPTISINDVTVDEDAGTATFTVSLDHATTAPVSFDYSTSDGSADGDDYTSVAGSLEISVGATEVTITVPITDDLYSEGDETFTVTLSNVSDNVDLTGSDLEGVGTIQDGGSGVGIDVPDADDTVYAVLSGDTDVEEGDSASYTVSLVDNDGNPVDVTEPTEVTITLTSGTAEAGDYAETPVTVTIQPGDSSVTVDVATFEDIDFDDETFTAEITSVEDTGEFEAIEVGTDSSVETTILDNDTAPTISINDVTVDENAGTATFTVSLDHATTDTVSFDYATSDGSADSADYTSVSGSLEIPTGSTAATITVPITDDLYSEGDETFTVTLSNVSANVDLTGSDLEGVGTLQDSGSGAGIDVPDADDTVYAVLSGDDSVEEGDSAAYTVSLVDNDGNPVEVTEPTEVTITLTSGTAEAGDYAETPVTVTIQPGDSSATVDVATFEDIDFDDETFTAEITSVEDTGEFEAIEVGSDSSVETTILDNDTAPVLSIDDVTVDENAGTATFTVSLDHATTDTVSFDYATSDGSADSADYTSVSGSLEIPTGSTEATITVPITDDLYSEGNETFTVTLSNVSDNVDLDGSDLDGVGTIQDSGSGAGIDVPDSDDTVFAVLTGDADVEEGEAASYTVSLVDNDGNPVEVTEPTEITITLTSGTAEAGDYVETPVTVTIQPGQSSATVDVATFEDVDFDDETFTVEITSVEETGEFEAIEVGSDSSVETTILDNDTAPTLSIDDVTVNESAGTATFTISLDHATTDTVSFDYATSDGSADSADYTSVSGSLEIPTGSTAATITVPITDDLYSEGDETFTVTLSNVSANVDLTGSDLEGVGTLQDSGSGAGIDVPDADDTVYAVLSGDDSVEEGDSAAYTVSLVDNDGNPVEVTEPTEVTITLTSGTAEAGDYAETPVTVTIQPGDSSATVDVATYEDIDFDDETFTVEITSVEETGEFEAIEVGSDSSVETTILDNDTAPVLSIDDVTVDENAGTATFTVSLDHATTDTVSFDYATSDGSADSADYTSVSGSLEIPAGSTEVTITVPITDDLYSEGDETFTVTLSNVSNNVDLTGSDLEGVGTIQDSGSGAGIDVPNADDTVYAVLSGDGDVTEGDSATYTVSLVDNDGNPVEVIEPTEVTITLTSGTAEAGDYAETPVTVTIQPGDSSATVDVATYEDIDFDDETFTVEITSVEETGEFEAIEVGSDSSVETTILDNDTAPTISIDDVTVDENAGTATFTVSLDHATTDTVSFDYATSDGSADSADYTSVSGSLEIPTGSTEATITVPITDDLYSEGDETFTVTLSNVSNNVDLTGSDLEGVGTIQDSGSGAGIDVPNADDTVYAVLSGDGDVTEGDSATYTVSLVDNDGNPVEVTEPTEVTVTLISGTAEAGDYAETPVTVTILPGDSSVTVDVATFEDIDFDDETFTSEISSVEDTGEFEAIEVGTDSSVETTILDNDTAPVLSIDDVTVDENAGTATFTVSLDHATTDTISFDYATSDGSADSSDYSPVTGTMSIAAGATEVTITVPITDDVYSEGDETFTVTLSNVSDNVDLTGSDLEGVGTIQDSGSGAGIDVPDSGDTVYAVLTGDSDVDEGQSASYTVSLYDGNANLVEVSEPTEITVTLTSVSAEEGDYDATPVTVILQPGQSSVTFDVATYEDIDLDDEAFTVAITHIEATGEFEAVQVCTTICHVETTIVDEDTVPVAVDDSMTTAEDTVFTSTIDLDANDTDSDGDSLSVIAGIYSTTQGGTIEIASDGSYVYTPAANFYGIDSVDYTVTDGNNTDVGTLTILVTSVNDAPVASDTSIITDEDVSYVFNLDDFNFSDADNDTSDAIRIDTLPTDGTLYLDGTEIIAGTEINSDEIANGLLTFVPASNDSGIDAYNAEGEGDQLNSYTSFEFSVSDGQEWSSSATLTVDVTPVADAPILTIDNQIDFGSSGLSAVLPAADGLVMNYYDSVDLPTSTSADTDLVEATLEGTVPTTTETVSEVYNDNVDHNTIETGDAYSYTGLIFLEAGQTLTLSGYIDDTMRIEIGGDAVYDVGYNSWGEYPGTLNGTNSDIGTGSFTALESGYYTVEMFFNNSDNIGAYSVYGSIDGADPVVLNTENFYLYTSTLTLDTNGVSYLPLVANGDGGYYPIQNAGGEGLAIQLSDISADVADSDGSEILASIVISGIPEGCILSDGEYTFTATSEVDSIDVTAWDLTQLTYIGVDIPEGGTVHSLTVTATSQEIADGIVVDSADTSSLLNIYLSNTDPFVQENTAIVYESALANGTDSDNNAEVVTGNLLDNDYIGSGNIITDVAIAGGTTVVVDGSITVTTAEGNQLIVDQESGEYTYTLLAASSNESDSFTYTAGDLVSTLDVTIVDDSPIVSSEEVALTVAVNTISVQNLEAGFSDAVFLGGTGSVTHSEDDTDSYADAYYWGVSADQSGNRSGYTLADNTDYSSAEGQDVTAGELIVLGDFSHENWPIYANSSTLDSIDLNVEFDVVINGITEHVSFVINLDHEETPNDTPSPEDIITIAEQSYSFVLSGTEYTVNIEGFMDPDDIDAGVVSTIYTDENDSNHYQLMATITSTDALPSVSGNVLYEEGADGSDTEVVWGDTASDYGTLIANADGSYEFEVNRETRDSLSDGDSLTQEFSYSVTDNDGDTVSATLVIHIAGETGSTLTGSDGLDHLVGSDSDDTLIDSLGNDILTGGDGIDLFDFNTVDDGAVDTITDFTTGSEGDVLDISDLLDGETAETLSAYLHFETGDLDGDGSADDTLISIDQDGGSVFEATQSIVLQDNDLSAGGTLADQEIINTLLTNHNLTTD